MFEYMNYILIEKEVPKQTWVWEGTAMSSQQKTTWQPSITAATRTHRAQRLSVGGLTPPSHPFSFSEDQPLRKKIIYLAPMPSGQDCFMLVKPFNNLQAKREIWSPNRMKETGEATGMCFSLPNIDIIRYFFFWRWLFEQHSGFQCST